MTFTIPSEWLAYGTLAAIAAGAVFGLTMAIMIWRWTEPVRDWLGDEFHVFAVRRSQRDMGLVPTQYNSEEES